MPGVTLAEHARKLAEEGTGRDEAQRQLLKAVALHRLEGDPASVRAAIAEAYGPGGVDPHDPERMTDPGHVAAADVGADGTDMPEAGAIQATHEPEKAEGVSSLTGASNATEVRTSTDAATIVEGSKLRIVHECDHTGDRTPEPTPEIIDGVLRRGHKMEITGPSKSTKSWLLYGLGLKLATGEGWLERHLCHRSRVLIVNTELDENSHHIRVDKIRRAFGMDPCDYAGTLDSVTLRGLNMVAEEFVNEIEEITSGARYDVILLDSIYKLFDGVENDAHDVKLLFAQMDRMLAMGTSVVFTHHHAKGAAGGRDAIDRGSGSGVFGRDPDAILDLSPLIVDPGSGAWEYLRAHDLRKSNGEIIPATALRLTYTLREFAPPAPANIIFRYPTHQFDHNGELDECRIRGTAQEFGSRGGQERARKFAEQWSATDEALGRIVADLTAKGMTPTRAACLEPLNEWRKGNGMEPWSEATFTKETKPAGHLTWHPSPAAPYGLERKG